MVLVEAILTYVPISVSVHELWKCGVGVGARADDQQDHEQQRLEIEERGL